MVLFKNVQIAQEDISNLDMEPLLAKNVNLVNMLHRQEAERVQNVNLVAMRILTTVNRVKYAVLVNTKMNLSRQIANFVKYTHLMEIVTEATRQNMTRKMIASPVVRDRSLKKREVRIVLPA